MNRGRGRGVDGGRQWAVRGSSSGSSGRSSFQRDHDEPNRYSYNENQSGGRGISNQKKVEDLDQKSVSESHKNFGKEGCRGNSYRKGWSYVQVRSKEEHTGQFHLGRGAPDSVCGSSSLNVSSAVSIDNTSINVPSLTDQAQPGIHDTDLSKIRIIDNHLKGVEKSTDFINESEESMNVSKGETWQPGMNTKPYGNEKLMSDKLSAGNMFGNKSSEPSEVTGGYDICFTNTGTAVKLKPSLLAMNRGKRNEMKQAIVGRRGEILGPGLILLKNHLSLPEQAQIVNVCQRLGQGPGGFYQPGYQDGAKLRLKMMCLGKNWDPETSRYVNVRPVDGARPPPLPFEFIQSVHKAIQDSHQLIKDREKNRKVEIVLPPMSPDLCIVNFYTEGGRLGLHQDRDESEESLNKGLPVVSFSIGDTAEFLYSDQRDADKADKVLLESGDVLIFGGKSRHIFHGVERILPNTAPKSLLGDTNLRPGRLNLTFRQY